MLTSKQYKDLELELSNLCQKMGDEIALIKAEYMPKISAITAQLKRNKPNIFKHQTALNVRKFKKC